MSLLFWSREGVKTFKATVIVVLCINDVRHGKVIIFRTDCFLTLKNFTFATVVLLLIGQILVGVLAIWSWNGLVKVHETILDKFWNFVLTTVQESWYFLREERNTLTTIGSKSVEKGNLIPKTSSRMCICSNPFYREVKPFCALLIFLDDGSQEG